MREKELRKVAICAQCQKPFGHTGMPLFWRVTIERHGVNAKALQRQQGLTMMLGGNAALAHVMGPDEEMTMPLMDPVTVTICENCSMEPIIIPGLVEE